MKYSEPKWNAHSLINYCDLTTEYKNTTLTDEQFQVVQKILTQK